MVFLLINTNKESFLVYGEETLYVGPVRLSVGMSSFFNLKKRSFEGQIS